jgi:hypothetical protein
LHVVANLRRFPDHDAHTVIDEKPSSYDGCWMDFYPGQESGDLRDDPGNNGYSPAVKPVGNPMRQDRVKAWIAKEDLNHAPRGWILAKNGIDLFPNRSQHSCSTRVNRI